MKSILFLFSWLTLGLSVFAQSPWEKLTERADSLDQKRQFEESLSYRAKALEAASKESMSIQRELQSLQSLTQAEFDFTQSRPPNPDAFIKMQQATELLQKQESSPIRISRAYRRLSENAFDYMYQAEDAEKYLQTAFDYYDKSTEKDTIYLIEMMQFSGYISILSPQKKFAEAIEISERGLNLLAELQAAGKNDNDIKAKLYYNLSLVHGTQFLNIPQKEYQYALESEKVLAMLEQPDIEPLVLMYRRLASFERDYRNYDKAKGYMHKAKELYKKHQSELRARIGFKLELALHRLNIAILMENGEEEQMLKELSEVEGLVKNNVFDEIEKANYKGILNFVTAYYIDIKPDLKEGAKFNDRALAIYIDSKKAPYSLEGFSQTTRVYQIKLALMQKAYQKAMVWINEAEKASGYHADRVLYQLKVQCLLGLGKLQEAIDAVDQLLAVISAENSSFSFATSSAQDFTPGYIISDANGLVRLAEAFRNYHGKPSVEEEKLYWLALTQLQHNIGNTPLNQELKKTFDKISSGLMKAALNRNFSREENNKLLTFMEILSSQDLINNFLLKREIAGNTGLYRLVEEEQFIRAYITFLKKELQKRDSEDTRQQLFEKEIELKKIREQLAAQYRQSNLFVVPQVDINTGNKKNIIKFNVTGNKLFKQRLHQGKLTYHKIDDYPTLKRDIEDYLRAINNLQTPVSTIKKKGTVLYNKLFTNDFETIRPTVIIADDILHYLPFELLVKDNAYLLENHTISYASSFYFLNSKGKEGNVSRNKKAVFFAPEYSGTVQENQLALRDAAYTLSGAKEEVKQLSKLIAGRKYIGNQASKRNFKSLDPDISILHLAMHSNLNDGDPELSNLMFSNTEEDYEMYISELYGMNFNADLAVLSACNTGIGGFKDGGNLVSIHQAFTIAGIPATIASLWHAPDHSTKEIMLSFYKNLQQGQDKAVALRQAKLDYLQQTTDENLQHPLYWAGFVLSGDDTPVELPTSSLWRQSRSIGGILLSILLITIVILVSKRRNRRNIA